MLFGLVIFAVLPLWVVADGDIVRCYDCHYNPRGAEERGGREKRAAYGGFPKCALDQPTTQSVDRWPCKSKTCFVRKDYNGLVYRGCADHWNMPWKVDISKNCQLQGAKASLYWFCKGDLCNTGDLSRDLCPDAEQPGVDAEPDEPRKVKAKEGGAGGYGFRESPRVTPYKSQVWGLDYTVTPEPLPLVTRTLQPYNKQNKTDYQGYKSYGGYKTHDSPYYKSYRQPSYKTDYKTHDTPYYKSYEPYYKSYDYKPQEEEITSTGKYVTEPEAEEATYPSYKSGDYKTHDYKTHDSAYYRPYNYKTYNAYDYQPKPADYKPERADDYASDNDDAYKTGYNYKTYGASDYKTHDSNDYKTHNSNDYKTHDANDYKTHDANDYKTHNANDYKTHNAYDYKTHNSNDYKTHDANDYKTHNANDYKSGYDYKTHDASDYKTHDASFYKTHDPAAYKTHDSAAYKAYDEATYKSYQPYDDSRDYKAEEYKPADATSDYKASDATDYKAPEDETYKATGSYDYKTGDSYKSTGSYAYKSDDSYKTADSYKTDDGYKADDFQPQEAEEYKSYKAADYLPDAEEYKSYKAADYKPDGSIYDAFDNGHSRDFAESTGYYEQYNPCDGKCLGNPSGLFPFEGEDDMFVQCANGRERSKPCRCCTPYYLRCPDGTTFQRNTKVCAEPEGPHYKRYKAID